MTLLKNSIHEIHFACHGGIDPLSFPKLKEANFIRFLHLSSLIGNEEIFDDIYYDEDNPIYGTFYYKNFLFIDINEYSITILEQKLKVLNDDFSYLLKKKNYMEIFNKVDKKILLYTFIKYFDNIPDNKKYDIFVEVYTRNEYGFEMLIPEFMQKVFSFAKFSKERTKRLKKLCKLHPGYVEIFHGENFEFSPNDDYSWTLDYDVARFFAYRFNSQGQIHEKVINCTQAIDFIESRNESEILLNIYENKEK